MEGNPKTGSGPQTSWNQFSTNFGPVLCKLFQKDNTVPPFNVDGFETRYEKLVCNVLKKVNFFYQVPPDLKVLLITSNTPLYSTIVY